MIQTKAKDICKICLMHKKLRGCSECDKNEKETIIEIIDEAFEDINK